VNETRAASEPEALADAPSAVGLPLRGLFADGVAA